MGVISGGYEVPERNILSGTVTINMTVTRFVRPSLSEKKRLKPRLRPCKKNVAKPMLLIVTNVGKRSSGLLLYIGTDGLYFYSLMGTRFKSNLS